MSARPGMLEIVLLGYLRKHCQGEAAARTQGKIARDLQALGLAVEPRDVRDAAAVLVDAGFPIGTSEKGCFICISGRDFRHAYKNLATRMRAQGRRCRRFKAIAREALTGQRTFDFAAAEQKYADLEAAPLLAGAGEARP